MKSLILNEYVLKQVIRTDPRSCLRELDKLQQKRVEIKGPLVKRLQMASAKVDVSPEDLADRVIRHYARKAALQGLITGIPSNPAFAAALALVDLRSCWQIKNDMAATLLYLQDPDLFSDPRWRERVLELRLDPYLERPSMPALSEAALRAWVGPWLTTQSPRWVTRAVLRRMQRRATSVVARKAVPVVGATIGAASNYVECVMAGNRMRTPRHKRQTLR